jgi:hypothetical protein
MLSRCGIGYNVHAIDANAQGSLCLYEMKWNLFPSGKYVGFSQADINSFSKLNTKFHELEDDLKTKKVAT